MTDMTLPTWYCGCGVAHYLAGVKPGEYKCGYGCGETYTAPNVDENGKWIKDKPKPAKQENSQP